MARADKRIDVVGEWQRSRAFAATIAEAVVTELRHGASISPSEGRLRHLPSLAVRAELEALAGRRLVTRVGLDRYRMAAKANRGLL